MKGCTGYVIGTAESPLRRLVAWVALMLTPAASASDVTILASCALLATLFGLSVYVAVPSSWIPTAAWSLSLIALTEAIRLVTLTNRKAKQR